jgi:hypothetical protein
MPQEEMCMRSRMGYKETWPHGEYDWDEMYWRPYYYYQQSGRGSGNQYGGSGSNQGGMGSSGMGSSSQGGSSSNGSTSYYGGPNYYYSEGQNEMRKDDLKQVNKYLSELNDELPHMMEKSSPEEKKLISDKL